MSFELRSAEAVTLAVFDILGRKVVTLVDGEPRSRGRHEVAFHANGIAPGVYFYRLQAGTEIATRQMVIR